MATTKRGSGGNGVDVAISEESWRKDVPPGLEHGLRNYWFPIALSSEVLADKPFAITVLCEDLVVWRDSASAPHVFVDSCPHRAVKLSVGSPRATARSRRLPSESNRGPIRDYN